jgi:hypothetical protein
MPDNNPAPVQSADACRCRLGIFVYDLIVVLILLAVAVYYLKNPAPFTLGSANLNIAVRATWFGALGGIVISLKGVYDHCCHRGAWDDCFDLWHVGRPFSGGLTGLITLVLLLAVYQNGAPSEPVVYAIAFIFGTQERRFFNFLSEVAALVVRVPNEDQNTGLTATDIQPSQGTADALVVISGHGFAQGATVTIGANPLANVVVSKDGTTIAGSVPAGGPGPAEVTIANPDGKRVVLKGRFTYTA